MIDMIDICKTYKNNENDLYAVDHVSLHVDEGEFLSIMGRSGCGKSSLLNILGLIDTYNEGSFFLDGVDMKKTNQNELSKLRRSTIGYIYQAYNLIDELNCIDNIELTQGYAGVSRSVRRKRAEELLSRIGLIEKGKLFPQQLSGGQQQRIAIARAISNNPRLILADEPTGNLDYNTGVQVMELLKQLNNEGITIVMVTHDKEISSYATRVLHMIDGKIKCN